MSPKYCHTIETRQQFEIGDEVIFHADPRELALQPGDLADLARPGEPVYGMVRVQGEIGNNTYRGVRVQ